MPETIRVSRDSFAPSTVVRFLDTLSDERTLQNTPEWCVFWPSTCPDSSTTASEGQQMWSYESHGRHESGSGLVERHEFRLQRPFKRITLSEAFASALRQLEEAEERQRRADELEGEFVAELLDFLDEEA